MKGIFSQLVKPDKIWRFVSVLGPAAVLCLVFVPSPASGLQIDLCFQCPGFSTTIIDNDFSDPVFRDQNPADGLIEWNLTDSTHFYQTSGTLSAGQEPGLASLLLTDFTYTRTNVSGLFSSRIIFSSMPFPQIGPSFLATVGLDGEYFNTLGGTVVDADVKLTGFANTTDQANKIGEVDPAGAVGSPSPHPFFPSGSTPPEEFDFGVTRLHGVLEVTLGAGGLGTDGIFLPASATVAVVPEPSTLFLLGTGLAGLAGLGRKRLPRARSTD